MKRAKSTILLVDDKVANIYALQKLLEKSDRELLTAASGSEALKIMMNRYVDLIILDVQMPDMDGFEVAQMMKTNKKTRDIPILFVSAEKKEEQSILKGFEEGAVEYLSKPLNPEVTKAKVAVLLKLELQRQELLEKNAELEKTSILIRNCLDIICTIDPVSFKFTNINPAAAAILGYEEEEMKQYALSDFLNDEDKEKIRKLKSSAKDRLFFETKVPAKDNTIRWLQWNVVVRKGIWYANARDITEAKQAEYIKNYLATVVKQSYEAIYLCNLEYIIISWNKGAENIYGYSESDVLNQQFIHLVAPSLQSETKELMDRVSRGEWIIHWESKRVTKTGKTIDVIFSATTLYDEDNNPSSIAITEQDITEQRLADKRIKSLNAELKQNILQLEMSNNELETFSYSVSHDLRAPLRALSGYTQVIEEDYSQQLDREVVRLLGIIKYNAQKMGALIDDLLAFSRLGRKEVKKIQIDMNAMIENILMDMHANGPVNATFTVSELPLAKGDYGLIKQAMVNLISNAVKYSSKKENPQVEVGASIKPDEVIYYVRDNGIGFNMRYYEKLFGVFQRLHVNEEFEGTGVGLAIVNKIIVKHGGRVWAEGKVNEGATFYFSLPC